MTDRPKLTTKQWEECYYDLLDKYNELRKNVDDLAEYAEMPELPTTPQYWHVPLEDMMRWTIKGVQGRLERMGFPRKKVDWKEKSND